jgi:hypothetical protein
MNFQTHTLDKDGHLGLRTSFFIPTSHLGCQQYQAEADLLHELRRYRGSAQAYTYPLVHCVVPFGGLPLTVPRARAQAEVRRRLLSISLRIPRYVTGAGASVC